MRLTLTWPNGWCNVKDLFEAIQPRNGSCLVIAEAGVNHNGSLERALELVRVAAGAGADVVKFQTFKAKNLASAGAKRAEYQAANIGGPDETQLQMLSRLELPLDWHKTLQDEAHRHGIAFLSTPFDDESLDFLVGLGVPALKVSSGDLTNTPFLRRMAETGLPVVLSTGMGTWQDVDLAMDALLPTKPILLQCVSQYPAPAESANLLAMVAMRDRYGVMTGYSDHCLGNTVSLSAVALGASVIEKHFTLDRALPGPDHSASSTPDELASLVEEINTVLKALGSGNKIPDDCELSTLAVAQKSLVAAHPLASGTRLSLTDIAVKRPGTGIRPSCLESLVGKTLLRDVDEDHLFTWEDVQ